MLSCVLLRLVRLTPRGMGGGNNQGEAEMTLPAGRGVATRRDVLKGALKTGAYAAPVIVMGAIPMAVGAVTAPTMTPVPTGPRVFVAPTSGPAGTTFAIAGTGFPVSTTLEIRLISGPVAAATFPVTTSATGVFFTTFTVGNALGTRVLAVEPVGTTNVLAQFSLVETTGTLPTTPVLTANPTSAPVGTNFAFYAAGLTPNTTYDVRVISAPTGNVSNVVLTTLTADALGQIPFGLNTSINGFPGTTVLGIAPRGTTTILAQAAVTATSVTGQDVPRTGGNVSPVITGPAGPVGG